MKLGLLTAALPEMTLEEVAQWASGNGFGMLEVACWPAGKAERRYAGVSHIDVEKLDKKRCARDPQDAFGLWNGYFVSCLLSELSRSRLGSERGSFCASETCHQCRSAARGADRWHIRRR